MIFKRLNSYHRPKNLLCLLFIECVVVQCVAPSRIVFDMTKQLNDVLSHKILKEDFIAALDSNPVFREENLLTDTVSLLYATDCNILEVSKCTKQINNVGNLVNQTFGRITNNFDLIISLILDTLTILKLGEIKVHKKIELPEIPLKLLINLHENTTCEDIKNFGYMVLHNVVNIEQLINSHSTTKLGFGCSEEISHCQGKDLSEAINKADFLVLNIKFGTTVGVTESYGLFQKRLDSLHEGRIKFIKHNLYLMVRKLPELIYFPTPSSVGDESYRRLLMTYAERWTTKGSGKEEKIMIIQTPYFEPELINEFTVIPDVQSNTCNSTEMEIKNLIWYAPSAMATISKYFGSVFFTHNQWKTLNSEEVENLYKKIKTQDSKNIYSDVFLDFTDTLVHHDKGLPQVTSCIYEWNQVEKELHHIPIEPLSNVVPKVLIFQISNQGTNKMKAHVPLKFAKRISSNFKLGCSFKRASFSLQNETKAKFVVEACKEINGDIYILHSQVNLQSRFYQHNYNLHYEDSVREELEAVDKFRNHILSRQPNAKVYLRLDVWGTKQVYIKENYEVTAFCNPVVLDANLYIEAILNWAKLHNFPVVLKYAFDYLNRPDFSGWLSFLRPVEYPTQSSNKKPQDVAALNPQFVLRNYPNGINNWNVDPCIKWTEDRPTVGVNYFHNHHIGAIFNTKDFMKYAEANGITTYETLLQFLFYRFYSVEIVVGNNIGEINEALKLVAPNHLIQLNRQFFINYETINTDLTFRNLELSNFLEQLNVEMTPYVKGVHLNLQEITIVDEDLQYIQQFVDGTEQLNLQAGILVNLKACMDIAKLGIITDDADESQLLKLLPKLNYIVCKSELDMVTQDDQRNLGYLFDTHLYLKRVFHQIQPDLNLFFRVELNVVLNDDKVIMDRYLRMLTHFEKFGIAYDINYFIVEAFDGDSRTNGWWAIQNFSDLTDPYTYVEKESVCSGRSMWYPPTPVKIDTLVVEQNSRKLVIILSITFILLIVFVAISGFLYVRFKRLSKYLSDEEVDEFFKGKPGCKWSNAGSDSEGDSIRRAEYMKFKADYELPKMDLIIDTEYILGTGQFGTVYKGVARGKDAAIKKPNKDCPKGTFKSVLVEIKVLCYIGMHPNVVGFFGAYTREINKGILYVATELCANGSLESYLRKKKVVVARQDRSPYQSTKDDDFLYCHELRRFALEIANGMDYIESKHVVHGDLSARNVLLDENYTCKIGDFGLSRKLYEYQQYVKKSQEPLPWKWMAYESLTKMEFTSKSDVWSYGVTLYEIYSLGGSPYGGLNWTMEFNDELRNGLRLTSPEFASKEIYEKMLECWKLDAEQRPTFTELGEFFKKFYQPEYTALTECRYAEQ